MFNINNDNIYIKYLVLAIVVISFVFFFWMLIDFYNMNYNSFLIEYYPKYSSNPEQHYFIPTESEQDIIRAVLSSATPTGSSCSYNDIRIICKRNFKSDTVYLASDGCNVIRKGKGSDDCFELKDDGNEDIRTIIRKYIPDYSE